MHFMMTEEVHMESDLVVAEEIADVVTLRDQARDYVRLSKAANTVRAYRNDWRHFTAWCDAQGFGFLPAAPETIALYLSAHAGRLRVATLGRRIISIGQAHRAAGQDDPTKHTAVRTVWQGIRRAHGVAPQGKAPAVTAVVRRMVDALPEGLLGVRDRALLLVGFAGAFRRSELVGISVEDLDFGTEGLVILLRRSKTDPEGAGRKVGIPYGSNPATCPIRALQAWLQATGILAGPVFRPVGRHGHVGATRLSDRAVALAVKRYAAAAGLDPTRYSGHSLRAGLATSAAAAGVGERSIMAQTGHRSPMMVRRYIRDGNLFRENAAAAVGL